MSEKELSMDEIMALLYSDSPNVRPNRELTKAPDKALPLIQREIDERIESGTLGTFFEVDEPNQ